MKTYLRLLSFARPLGSSVAQYGFFSFLVIVFSLAGFTLLIPMLNVLFDTEELKANIVTSPPDFSLSIDYARDTFNYYLGNTIAEKGKIAALQFIVVASIAAIFLKSVASFFTIRILAVLRARVTKNLRERLFEKIISLDNAFFSRHKKGDLTSRLTGDVQEIEGSIISSVTVIMREPLTLISYFFLLFAMSFKLTLFTLIVFPVAGAFISQITKRLRKESKDIQGEMGSMLTVIDESLTGIKVIKGFNAEHSIAQLFNKINSRYAKIVKSIILKKDFSSPVSEFLGVVLVTGMLLYGGSLVLNKASALSASEFITYIILLTQVLAPAKAITSALSSIQRGLAAGDRVFEILDSQVEIFDQPNAKKLDGFHKEISFEQVSFRYGANTERAALEKISFTVKKGETVALVGPSGGGKSTLADLISRFFDPSEGAVKIDGHDLRDCQLVSVRELMGIVTQESILFNDTIFSNIAFGKNTATEAEIIQAAKIANAHDFIVQTPQGYQTEIGDRGTKLSGGQRQRLNIARAVLKNPDILILDEATSALDTESEKMVQDALNKLMANRTSIVIAHRLSTIQHADKILVIDQGQLVEFGTHEDLLAKNGLYKKLHALQAS